MSELKGRAFLFGDNLNTDYVISGKYKFKTLDMNELAKHVMEDIRPGFHNEIEAGDFVVAGENLGAGSSREQAPLVLKAAGIGAVVAKSFARIFYRNCINVGLPVVEVDTSDIAEGDVLEIDIESGVVKNVTKGVTLQAQPLPPVMMKILADGGLAEHIKKNGGFALEDEEPSD
jgi:3-isopropylmalate/(R)-2-methylmalate dehydratase small subunit